MGRIKNLPPVLRPERRVRAFMPQYHESVAGLVLAVRESTVLLGTANGLTGGAMTAPPAGLGPEPLAGVAPGKLTVLLTQN